MDNKLLNAKEAWKMNQVISAMNNEEAYFDSGWLYIWPDESTYQECVDNFSDEESFKELKRLYLRVFKNYYEDGLYKPESIGPDALDYAKETLTKLNIKGELKETEYGLWEVVEEQKEAVAESSKEIEEAKTKEPKHLKELIAKLNEPITIDDEVLEANFEFKLVNENGRWFLFDAKENYHIGYEEDLAYMYHDLASEFGMKTPEVLDQITPQLDKAVEADFGEGAFLEWENNVRMSITPSMDESEHKQEVIEEGKNINLTDEMLKELNESDYYFVIATDKDGHKFIIIDGFIDLKGIQEIIQPGFEPKDKWDSSVLDSLNNVGWGYSDEWAMCDECGQLIRTSPDSYSFIADYWVDENNGQLLCGDCVLNNHSDEYLESLINNASKANTILLDAHLREHGFTKIDADYESGLYDKQDNPEQILKDALEKHPNGQFIFSISGQGQFATQFELWAKEETLDDEDEHEDSEEKEQESLKEDWNKKQNLKESEQLNEMIIDLILDRKDGEEYSPKKFYKDCSEYSHVFKEIANKITRAMDGGSEADVKKALCDYVRDQDYNPKICDYINSVNWLDEEVNEKVEKDSVLKYSDAEVEKEKQEMNKNSDKVGNSKFTLSNPQTHTWMDYYKEIEGTQDEEELRSLYDANWEGICQYNADVMMNGKKLFRVQCWLFIGMGEWVEYHIEQEDITDLGRKILEESDAIAYEDSAEVILDIDDVDFDENSTVEKMLQPVLDLISGAKIEEDVEKHNEDDVLVYEFPNEIENFLPEFQRLCDEHDVQFLGKGKGFELEDNEYDFFAEGTRKNLEELADDMEYELHPDFLTPADDFDYEDILIEKKLKMTEATQKQVDDQKRALNKKTGGKNYADLSSEDKLVWREIHARDMMISILVYQIKPDADDSEFDALFEKEIGNHYLGDYLKVDKFGGPAISKERLKELWNDMVKDFKNAEVGDAGEDPEGLSYNYVRYKDESLKESMDKKFTDEEVNKYVKELTQLFFDDGEYFDIWNDGGSIRANIEWGDWKHDHLHFKTKVQKYFDKLGIKIDIDSDVTEEDGSDSYSALYDITKK